MRGVVTTRTLSSLIYFAQSQTKFHRQPTFAHTFHSHYSYTHTHTRRRSQHPRFVVVRLKWWPPHARTQKLRPNTRGAPISSISTTPALMGLVADYCASARRVDVWRVRERCCAELPALIILFMRTRTTKDTHEIIVKNVCFLLL